VARTLVCAVSRDRRRKPSGHNVSALATLAARTVGRRVRLAGGHVGIVTRVTGRGYIVSVPNLTRDDVTFLDD